MKRSGTSLRAKPIVDSTKEKLIHVLYVDDEVGLLNAAKPILEMQGPFNVETASSVKQAIQKMQENPFDVIVSDYQMPKENGLDFLKKLRENGNNIPFILFTGKGREEVAIKALNLGADRYVNKIGDPATVYGELAYGIRSTVRTKSAEEELIRLSSAVKTSTDCIIITDLNVKIIDANEAALKMYGAGDKADLIGKNSFELLVPEDRKKALIDMKETLEKGYDKSRDYHIFTKNGNRIPVEMSTTVMKAPDGKPIGFVGIARDITERKKAEEKLLESEEKFRNLAEKSPNMIFINKKGRVVYANKKCEELMGYKREEFYSPNFNFFTLIAPESIKLLKSIYSRHLEGNEIPPL